MQAITLVNDLPFVCEGKPAHTSPFSVVTVIFSPLLTAVIFPLKQVEYVGILLSSSRF